MCDDAWHPAEVLQRGFGLLADSTFAFEFVKHGARWSSAVLNEIPLVVVGKANHVCSTDQRPWLAAESQSAFPQFVRGGGGLVLVHAGTCYKELSEMRTLIGGVFLQHPDQCPVTVEQKGGHPLTAGVKPFTERDEHYFMALDDPQADVFLHTRSAHGVQTAGWTRTVKSGRVGVLTPGHNLAVWLQTEFQKLLLNTLRWAAKLN